MSTPTAETLYSLTTLPNGLRVITAPMPQTRSVTVGIYVGAGSRYETAVESGISHFIEHLCFKGTAKRPNAQLISEAIDGVGGVLNAATDREYTVYYAKVARQHLGLAVDVLSDLVQAPLYDAEEMEKERKVVIEELASVADSPAQQVDILLDELLWPDQPLGWDVAGSNESMAGITRDMVIDYSQRQYAPNNVVVSIAGNVDEEETLSLLSGGLGSMKKGKPSRWFKAQDNVERRHLGLINRRSEQSHIAMGIHALPMEHPDRYALDLLSVFFGESMSSRLFMELRERQGLCYDVHSYVSHFLDTGSFGIYAAVDPSNGKKAAAALVHELERLADGVPEEELSKARELAKGRLLLRMEDTRAVSGWLGGQAILTGDILTPDDVVAKLDAVTTEDVERVVRLLLEERRLHLAVVGPHRSENVFLPFVAG